MGTASLGPGSWLKAAQIPAGGDVSSMNPIETSARARMRGAKLTASKYAAVRPTSGRSTSQLGYGAARPCSGPSKSQPAGTCAMSAVTRVSSPATAKPCWPPMLVPITTSVLPFQSARLVRYSARSEEHTSELQSRGHLVCRLLLEKKKKTPTARHILD